MKNVKSITLSSLNNFIKAHSTLKNVEKCYSIFNQVDSGDEDNCSIGANDKVLLGSEVRAFLDRIKEFSKSFIQWHNSEENSSGRTSGILWAGKKNNSENYDKAIEKINSDNVMEILTSNNTIRPDEMVYKILSYELSSKDFNKYFDHIKNALKEYAQKNGIDTSKIDERFSEQESLSISDKENFLIDYLDSILQHQKNLSDKNQQQELKSMLNDVLNFDSQNLLDEALDEAYSKVQDKKTLSISTNNNIDLPNGKLDKASTQLSGNCWLQATINSMKANDVTKTYLEKCIKRDENKKMTAVYIKEAEQNGYPKPKGNGIFVFSDAELAEAAEKYSNGDGDTLALILATEKYLSEAKEQTDHSNFGFKLKTSLERKNNTDSNSIERGFRLFLGLSDSEIKSAKDSIIPLGLSSDIADNSNAFSDKNDIKYSFEQLYNLINEKEGCAIVSANNHAYSVVGTEEIDGVKYLLVEESNNVDDSYLVDGFEKIENSNPPRYRIKESVYENFNDCATLKL